MKTPCHKRKLLKAVVSSGALAAWSTPIISIVSLPAHAVTSPCYQIRLSPRTTTPTPCEGEFMLIQFTVFIQTNDPGAKEVAVLDVYSSNPIHIISWERQFNKIHILMKEHNPSLCLANPSAQFVEEFSNGTITISTSCGLFTI